MIAQEKTQTDLVSVIIPVYNIESYVRKCLESISKQSYKNMEILIINDGSTDDTGVICDEFVKKDERFRVIHKNNSGVSDSRNQGIKGAKGKYLVFVDGDDYVAEDYISTLVRVIKCNTAEVGCADYYVESADIIEVHSDKTETVVTMNSNEAINLLSYESFYQGYLWNKIFERKVIIDNDLYFEPEIKIWEDMLFCLKYFAHIESVSYIHKPIYYYVQREGSAMNDPSIWNQYTHWKALECMWKEVQPFEGAFKEYIRNFYANDLASALGKRKVCDKESIRRSIKKIRSLHGKLSFKHRVKMKLFKILPDIMIRIYR